MTTLPVASGCAGVTLIFVCGAVQPGSKQHFGNPIQCMAPPESPDSWVHYYHDYCYIQDKLRIFDMSVRKSIEYEARQRADADFTPIGRFNKHDATHYWSPRVMYYQWVPYVLFLQAMFFLVPKLFWKLIGLHWCHGVDMETAVVEAEKLRTLVGEDRGTALNSLASFIRDFLEAKHKRTILGSSIASICYVVTKWLEVINAFGQLYMLSCFVGQGDYFWGYHLLTTVLNGSDDPNTGIFPRIVLCDVARFALANLHQEHMQCVLMLNFINEKIYTFLWFWIVFVAIASTFSAIRYTVALVLPMYRGLMADNFLPTQDVLFSNAAAEHGVRPTPVASRALVDYFVHKVLRGASSSPSDECSMRKKDSDALYWPSFTNLPTTMRKMGLAKRMEAAGDSQDVSFNDRKQYPTAQPMNLEAEPTAPIESSPLISDGSTQAVEDSTCPIQSLPASPGTTRRRMANTGPGIAFVDNRYGKNVFIVQYYTPSGTCRNARKVLSFLYLLTRNL
ncbi:innexin-3 domain protein [Ancylostoma duodenale]|uniref:Innexin n=1 Tax=Ancylostoma duodenale TaxID=51022 RepID=A0A0C2H2V0_9BILA|nr:innexin-3 domain protein [Ancylostoma duodenale]